MLPYLAIVLLIVLVANYFIEQKIILGSAISGAYKINRLMHQTNDTEIPFFGSSRAEFTYIPDSLVQNGFNYGMRGTQDDVIIFGLKEECKKNKKTPIVITFDLDGLNHSLGDISNYIYNAHEASVKLLLGSSYKKIYEVPFLKYYGHFEMYFKYYFNDKNNITKFTNKGATIEKDILTPNAFQLFVNERKQKETIFRNDPQLQIQLNTIISQNKNRLFIFIIAPYHSSFFTKYKNYEDAEHYLHYLDIKPNVKVFNFAKLKLDDSHFFNTSHLSLKGALEFNRILKDSLVKLKVL